MEEPEPRLAFPELLSCARRGDLQARDELFSRIADAEAEGGILLGIARRLLPADDKARDFVESCDLIQSALRSGWLDLSDFRGSTTREFLDWMRTIIRRKLSRVVRKKRPRPRGDDPGTGETGQEDAAAEDPLSALVRKEIRARVREAVAALPEDQQAVIRLRLEGLKATEIAEQLGLKAETVRKRESRASARLRTILKTYRSRLDRRGGKPEA